MSKYGVISGPYFPVFGLNTEIYSVNICIQSEYRKIQTRNNSVFGHFSRPENLGGYHDLYVQIDTLLLVDVFENFRNKCIEIYELDPNHFLSVPGLAWQACLKKTEVELELLTDIDMLLMVEKGI